MPRRWVHESRYPGQLSAAFSTIAKTFGRPETCAHARVKVYPGRPVCQNCGYFVRDVEDRKQTSFTEVVADHREVEGL